MEIERLNRSCAQHLKRWNIITPINYDTALEKLSLKIALLILNPVQ